MIDFLVAFVAWTLFVLTIDTSLRIGKLQREVKALHRYIVFLEGVSLDQQRIGDEAEASDD